MFVERYVMAWCHKCGWTKPKQKSSLLRPVPCTGDDMLRAFRYEAAHHLRKHHHTTSVKITYRADKKSS
jgi:hypothetical protein